MTEEFTCLVAHEGDRTVVTPIGELDLASAPDLDRALTQSVEQNDGDLVLDLGQLSFIDSTGLRTVLDHTRRQEAAGARLVIRACSDAVLRVLDLSGVRDHLVFDGD